MNMDFARHQMIAQQVRCWDVSDRSVLDVLEVVPREQFVPAAFRQLAYADTEIPLPLGEQMMKPIVEGRLLQSLRPGPTDEVLEVGSGSGFLTACLARLAAKVVSIDLQKELLTMAEANLADAGIENVSFHIMDAMSKLPAGKYDAIAVTASIPRLESRFLDALNPGGRLFVVVGEGPLMEARIVTRDGDSECRTTVAFETMLAPLRNVNETPRFAL